MMKTTKSIRRTPRSNRYGTLLVDLLVCMGAGSVVLLIAVQILHRSFELSRDSVQHSRTLQTIHRLDLQFRSDMGFSSMFDSAGQDQWRIQLPEGTVVYSYELGVLVRRMETLAGEKRVELFAFPEDATLTIRSENQSRKAILQVSQPRYRTEDRILMQCVASRRDS